MSKLALSLDDEYRRSLRPADLRLPYTPKRFKPHGQNNSTTRQDDGTEKVTWVNHICSKPLPIHARIPTYYVNLDLSTERRAHTEHLLSSLQLPYTRIGALSPLDLKKNVTIRVRSAFHHSQTELACLASHLIAIYTATHALSSKSCPYALIIEDDVTLEMTVDFNALAASAPPGFGILQLMTSNGAEVQRMWSDYKEKRIPKSVHASDWMLGAVFSDTIEKRMGTGDDGGGGTDKSTPFQGNRKRGGGMISRAKINNMNNNNNNNATRSSHKMLTGTMLWEPRRTPSVLWSTQAYLVNVTHLRQRIENLVTVDATGSFQVTLLHPSSFSAGAAYANCRKAHNTCMVPFRLVADSYLYAAFGPTYMLRIPLFNGANVGKESTVHVPASQLTTAISTMSSSTSSATTATATGIKIPSTRATAASASSSASSISKSASSLSSHSSATRNGVGNAPNTGIPNTPNVVASHIQAFREIANILQDVRRYAGLPSFITNCTYTNNS